MFSALEGKSVTEGQKASPRVLETASLPSLPLSLAASVGNAGGMKIWDGGNLEEPDFCGFPSK